MGKLVDSPGRQVLTGEFPNAIINHEKADTDTSLPPILMFKIDRNGNLE
jgi:hypothetical protein